MSHSAIQQAAARELLERREARRRLIKYTSYTYKNYIVERAHGLIGDTFDKVLRGEIKRLMVFAPPQHGKSELVSVRGPSFCVGVNPGWPVILASYGATLAESKGRQARDLLRDPLYQRVFPNTRLRGDVGSIQYWQIEGDRGGMLSLGVGGPITGRGAMLGIIDDPHANWADAHSEVARSHIWDWYRTTFRTRIWEGGAIVLIMTRWHPKDLAGQLLEDQPDQWTILRLPAIAESQEERDYNDAYLGLPVGRPDPLGRQAGEALCPLRFSKNELLQLKRDVGSLAWAAEYQGVPRAAEGNRFKRHWFKIVDSSPIVGQRVRYWDRAATEGGGNFTVGLLMSRAEDGRFYIEDIVRGQLSSLHAQNIMLQTAQLDAQRHGNTVQIFFEQEGGSAGKDAAQVILSKLAGFNIYADSVSGSKEVRAEPFAAQCEAGNVMLVKGAWNMPFIEEVTEFPNGGYDDQVDAASGSFNKLAVGRRFTIGFS